MFGSETPVNFIPFAVNLDDCPAKQQKYSQLASHAAHFHFKCTSLIISHLFRSSGPISSSATTVLAHSLRSSISATYTGTCAVRMAPFPSQYIPISTSYLQCVLMSRQAKIPSQAHIDLLNAGIITEPLLGINGNFESLRLTHNDQPFGQISHNDGYPIRPGYTQPT
jgi:hypothetical protein